MLDLQNMKHFIVASLLLSSLISVNHTFADAASFDCVTPENINETRFEGWKPSCKYITITNIVSVDKELLNEYLFGTHEAICLKAERGCDLSTKYSEDITIVATSSTVFKSDALSIENLPVEFAFFDKKFFLPVIKNAYNDLNMPFSENTFRAYISLYNKKEVDTAYKDASEEVYFTRFNSIKELNKNDPRIIKTDEGISIDTFNYLDYAKYIHGPKAELVESQYLNINQGTNILKDKDLGIRSTYRGEVNVPLTSPINSIVSYWKYTKVNNKITLVYDKTVATLDTGKTKILAQNDELIESTPTVPATSTSVISSTTSTVTDTQIVIENTSELKENKTEGFFSKFIAMLASWFKF